MAKTKPATTSRVRSTSSNDRGWGHLSDMYGLGSTILRRIGEAEALKQGAVTAATDVISQDVSKGRPEFIQRTKKGLRVVEANEHYLARRFMLDPNPHHTWGEVVEMLIRSLAIHQNAYLVKCPKSANDQDPELVPVHTKQVVPQASGDRFFYDVTADSMGSAAILGWSGTRRLTQDDIIHIRGRMHTGEIGLSTLIIGSDVLGLNQAMLDFQAGMAKNGLRPNAVVTTSENLTQEQFDRLKVEIGVMLENARSSGRPPLFEAGTEYKPIGMNAAETDLNKARQMIRQEVAALWRIPAYKIGAGETEKYDNKAAAEQTYVDDALIPIAKRFEDVLVKALLTDKERLKGYAIQINRDDLYDRDRQGASDRIVKQYDSGIIDRNEARGALNWGGVDDKLNTFKIAVNSAILHQDGDVEYVIPKNDAKQAPEKDAGPKEEPKKGFFGNLLPAPVKSDLKQPINVTVNMPEQKPQTLNVDVRPSGSKTITMVPKEDGSAEFTVKEVA